MRLLLRATGALALLPLLLLTACDSGTPGDDDFFDEGCEGDASRAILVNPTGTYFRTHQDAAGPPRILRLSDFGVAPGDQVLLERFGEYQYQGRGDRSLIREGMVGVFSSSNTVLAQDQPARVPGALQSSAPGFVTRPTLYGSFPTDIPQDFEIENTTVTVPAGAVFLFVSPNDDFFEDNIDEDQDYRVCITKL